MIELLFDNMFFGGLAWSVLFEVVEDCAASNSRSQAFLHMHEGGEKNKLHLEIHNLEPYSGPNKDSFSPSPS